MIRLRLISYLFLQTFFTNAQPLHLPLVKHTFVVIAHRGDHTAAPENTLLAYQHAIENGVDYVEIDLRTTKDNQLVIMHDATLDRMTGVHARIREIQLDSIRSILIKDPSHPDWGLHKIPTFQEVLALCKGKINIYLDFKDASVEAAYKQIREAGMEDHFIVYINNPQQIIDWRRVAPTTPLMISLPKKTDTPELLNAVLNRYPIDLLDGNYDEYNESTVKAAKQKKIPIWADIQNADSETFWNKALELGLDGLQTDHPKALLDFLRSKGKR